MLSLAAFIQDDGLTIGEMIRDIPHDGPAFLVYAMTAIFVLFIWHGSRKSGGPKDGE